MTTKPICDRCDDTHQITLHRANGDDLDVMCTSCPSPCDHCRQGGNGPFCTTTPCPCDCHLGSRFYQERTREAVEARAQEIELANTKDAAALLGVLMRVPPERRLDVLATACKAYIKARDLRDQPAAPSAPTRNS